MRCSHCGACCKETEMLLSKEDIVRLKKRGFGRGYFVKFDCQGYAQLRNREGYCVFYNRVKQRCSVYYDRPSGCRVYPVILDESVGTILDDICPNVGTITHREKKSKGKRVIKLLERIDYEAARKRS